MGRNSLLSGRNVVLDQCNVSQRLGWLNEASKQLKFNLSHFYLEFPAKGGSGGAVGQVTHSAPGL